MSQNFRKPRNLTHERHDVNNVIILQNTSELQWTVREQFNVKALNLSRLGVCPNLEQKITHLMCSLWPFSFSWGTSQNLSMYGSTGKGGTGSTEVLQKMPSIIRRNAVLISSLTGVVHLNNGDGMEGANHGKHLTFWFWQRSLNKKCSKQFGLLDIHRC